MTSTVSDLHALFEARAAAVWDKDIDRLLAVYTADVVYFDVVPGLRYVGTAALRDRFLHWFSSYQSPIGQAARDITIDASGDLAIAHMLIHASGTLATGRAVAFWVRVTDACRRTDGRWRITHEHVSLPVDLQAGKPALDLTP
jgi:ketosteroid isomerase-like protein